MKNIKEHIQEAASASLAGEVDLNWEIGLENPRNPEHGDLSTNIAFLLAKRLKSSPRKVAEEICRAFKVDSDYLERAEAAGAGFINFTYSRAYLLRLAADILTAGGNYGRCDIGDGKRVNLEFVSANPTGPLNIVSARAAALGDCLKRVLNACGYRAESEFYVNDAGRQVLLLGHSVIIGSAQIKGIKVEMPADGYHGSYVKDIAGIYKPYENTVWQDPSYEDKMEAGAFAVNKIVSEQKRSLSEFRVDFDAWVTESSIRRHNEHSNISRRLQDEGKAYEKDGALFFRSSEFGDDEDRVIFTSDGRLTYFLPDIAYHQDKYDRGFEWLIDIWGPDHHGYIPRMKAALEALGRNPQDTFTVIIAQQVNLMRGGEKITMSKRAGEMATMDDLLEEVGVDAARFFFLQRKASAHLDFDLDLAVKETEENPVFYVQYAHARICSIERFAEGEGVFGEPDWDLLKEKEVFDLMRKLAQYPMVVESCGRNLETPRITMYLGELAYSFHRFYQKHRVVTGDKELSAARLGLCRAVKIVLFNGLELLGVSTPESM